MDLLLLAAVADEPRHGYSVVEFMRERSDGAFDLSEGTVYPALYRLERAKLLSSRWAVVGGRKRRIYALTRAGGQALAAQRREWTEFAGAVKAVAGV